MMGHLAIMTHCKWSDNLVDLCDQNCATILRCIALIMDLMPAVGSVKSMAKSSIIAICLLLLYKHPLWKRVSRHKSIRGLYGIKNLQICLMS